MKEILFKSFEVDLIKRAVSAHYGTYSKDAKLILGKLERAEKKIKTSSAKGKGRGLQYWVCEKIAGMFGIEFKQDDDECLIHSREMGQHGTDIVLRGEVAKNFPFDIECKACESLSIPEWVRQAKTNKKENRDWLLIFKKQTMGHEPLVLMEWETFEKIIKKGLNK